MTKLSALSKGLVNKAAALFVVGALSSAAGATQLDAKNEAEESTEELVQTEKITDRRHPEYIRCRTESIIGSLARKRRVCMTNKQWSKAGKSGNRFADNMISPIQAMSGGGSFTDGK